MFSAKVLLRTSINILVSFIIVRAFSAEVMLPLFHQFYITLMLLSLLCKTPTSVPCWDMTSLMTSISLFC